MTEINDKYYINVNTLIANEVEQERPPRTYTSGIIERSQQDIDRETETMFTHLMKLLESGMSYSRALDRVMGIPESSHTNYNSARYKRLMEYADECGVDLDRFKSRSGRR